MYNLSIILDRSSKPRLSGVGFKYWLFTLLTIWIVPILLSILNWELPNEVLMPLLSVIPTAVLIIIGIILNKDLIRKILYMAQ